MVRSDFIHNIVDRFYLMTESSTINYSTVDCLLDIMAEVFAEGLKQDGKVTLKNIIVAEAVQTPKRKGYDPFHDRQIEYTPRKKIRVKIGKRIKTIVNS